MFARLIQFLIPPLFGASLEPYMSERPLAAMIDVRAASSVSDACLIARYKLLRWLYVNVHDYTQIATDRSVNQAKSINQLKLQSRQHNRRASTAVRESNLDDNLL